MTHPAPSQEGNIIMIEILTMPPCGAAIWLDLFDEPDSPAIYLTPLDWTQYEYARRLACLPGTTTAHPGLALRRLIEMAQPTDWRGFMRDGAPVPFDRDLLTRLALSNVTLGVALETRLRALAERESIRRTADAKNSDAGSDTPGSEPAKAKRKPSA